MSDDTKTAVVPTKAKDLSRAEFGTREDIAALGGRVQAMMPGGDKLSKVEAMATAQYALTVGANPFRGEIYAYKDSRGKLQLVEGYKLLVRWAKRQCDYTEWYTPLPALNDGDIGFTCYILRQDKHGLLEMLLKGGVDVDRAMDIVTVSAGGVVRHNEMHYARKSQYHDIGDPIDPPTGWTWEDVAKKRALKNALNKSHGVPSLQEIARESWVVNGREAEPEDWQDVTADMSPNEAEAIAAYNAQVRRVEATHPEEQDATDAVGDLYGDDAAADFTSPPEDTTEGETEMLPPFPEDDEAEPHQWTAEDKAELLTWTRNDLVITDAEMLRALGVNRLDRFTGDLAAAKMVINAYMDEVPA